MPTRTELANLALDFLYDRHNAKIPTPIIVEGVGLRDKDANRTLMRDVLDGLKAAGHVTKSGEGKFRWQITTVTFAHGWERINPFLNSRPGYVPPKEEEPIPQWLADQNKDKKEDDDETPIPADQAHLDALKHKVTQLKGQVDLLTTSDQLRLDQINELKAELKAKEDRIDKLEQMAVDAARHVRVLVIKKYDGKEVKLKDKVLPKVFPKVLQLARCRRNILLVGPAGCGKSYLAKLVADALGLKFGKVGGSGGLQEHHLLGWTTPNLSGGKDKFITTDFLRRFEEGGLCLIDEIDAADQNVMLALNPALDHGGDLPVPNRGNTAKKHKDFVCVATANTFGRGADRMYAGRNPLDEATIDRFRIGMVECDYDEAVDKALCPDDEIRTWCQQVRERINQAKMRRVMSSRFIEDAYVMVSEAGWTLEDVKTTFFEGWTREEVSKVTAA